MHCEIISLQDILLWYSIWRVSLQHLFALRGICYDLKKYDCYHYYYQMMTALTLKIATNEFQNWAYFL